jgi:hypothetical protein
LLDLPSALDLLNEHKKGKKTVKVSMPSVNKAEVIE